MALITYDDAVRHLNQIGVLDGSPDDTDIAMKMEQATSIVLVHLDRHGEWDASMRPGDGDHEFDVAHSLVLKVLAWLYRYRGDDETTPGLDTILNWDTVGMLKDRVIA